MKFRFYVVDMLAGDISGTDDEEFATSLSKCDDFWVLNPETGEVLTDFEGVLKDVQEITPAELQGDPHGN